MDRNIKHPFENQERPETNLALASISSPLDATEIFGTKINGGATPIVLVPRRNCFSLWVSIPEGCAAIVTSWGKFMGVYKPGWHWFPSWYHIQYLVNTQHIPYHFHIKECPTRDNVQIKIHVDILLHVTDPQTFVYDIGPEKLEELLRASQAESVRSLVRNVRVVDAYDLRGEESQDMVNSLNDKIKHYGVEVKQVTIANVTLPASIAINMQTETTFESKQTEQRKKQEYELKVLNDNNYLLRVKQDRDSERKLANEDAKRNRSLITQEIHLSESNYSKLLAEIEASKQYEVSKLNADARFTALKLQAQQERIVLETKAKGALEVGRMAAETQKYVTTVTSQAKVVSATNNAKSLETIGVAEQKAAAKLQAKRKFDLEMESIGVWSQMAANGNLLISAEKDENSLANQLFELQQISSIVVGPRH